jgi:hypothetical protein
MDARGLPGGVLAIVASCFLVTGTSANASEQGWKTHRTRHHHTRDDFGYSRDEYARGTAGYRGPYGYVFVPGHGILGAACNLPTSTCENQYRDVR